MVPFGLLVGSSVLGVLLLEVLLRLFLPSNPFSPYLPLRPHRRFDLRVNLQGISPVGTYSTNRWGLRGDEPPKDWAGTETYLAIGGSTTHCSYLDDHKTWPYRLQEMLKKRKPHVWVGNGGLDGQSTRAHLLFMRDVVGKLKPDGVIFLVGANDLQFSISQDARIHGIFFDQTNWRGQLFGYSKIIQTLYPLKLVLFDRVAVVEFDQSQVIFQRRVLTEPMPLPTDLKDLLVALPEYRANIERLIEMGKSLGVRMIFLSQPILFGDTPYWEKMEGYFFWVKKPIGKFSGATYFKMLDLYNQELRDICMEKGVEFLDLAAAIPHDEAYFYDEVHFNERGAERVAEFIAGYMNP